MQHSKEEMDQVVADYLALRERIEAGEAGWTDLAEIFTDDAVYIDPAWGRVEGIEAIREFLADSMTGLEDWKFPIESIAVDGDTILVRWTQILPGTRADGSHYKQSGYTTLVYAGNGKFRYEEDQLNMVHVLDDLAASDWKPGPGFKMPPKAPNRDFSIPD